MLNIVVLYGDMMKFCGGLPTGFERNPKKPLGCAQTSRLLGALVLGDSLGSFGDGVLGELSWKDLTWIHHGK